MSCLDGRNDPIVGLTLHEQYTKIITNLFHFGNLIDFQFNLKSNEMYQIFKYKYIHESVS